MQKEQSIKSEYQTHIGHFDFHIAVIESDFTSIVELVRRVYAKEGYVKAGDTNYGISAFIGKSYTFSTYAQHQGSTDIIGTISVVSDNSEGLPMDTIYREELQVYRSNEKKIAEACQFAIDTDLFGIPTTLCGEETLKLEVSVGLIRTAVLHCLHSGIDYLCFVVNPKHAAFYESLGCTRVGETKQYPSVNEAPACAYVLDVQSLYKRYQDGVIKNFFVARIFN